ncbi:unnamed protein product [Somion occarium]|uniref:Uncharacterized protein n=1 Tax=Somion occarium TaxID=3059160 RepID=A0ABP1CMK5_9APHY
MPMVSLQLLITLRSFSIVTSTDKPLQRDVKLLFTITLDGLAQSAKANTTFTWEIVSFSANSNDEKTFTWHPDCNMSLHSKDTFNKARVSDHVQPGNYVELDAINCSNATEEFMLGAISEASSNSEPFQPYILLRQLKKKEGLATAIPYCLQVYVITKCTRYHLITEKLSEGLLHQGGQEVPL